MNTAYLRLIYLCFAMGGLLLPGVVYGTSCQLCNLEMCHHHHCSAFECCQEESCNHGDSCQHQCCCCTDCGFFAGGDAMVWNVCDNDTDFAIVGGGVGGFSGVTQYLDYDWDYGFRAYAGYSFPCCNWDFRGIYTYFRGKAIGSASAPAVPNPQVLAPRIDTSGMTLAADESHAEKAVDYECWDALMSYTYIACGGSVQLRPFFGARGILLDQELEVEYIGGGFGPTGDGVKWESQYWGAGVHGGMESRYEFDCLPVCVYGRLSGSLVAGGVDTKQVQRTPGNVLNLKEDMDCLVLLGVEAAAGLCSNFEVCGVTFTTSVGYELVRWANTPVQRRNAVMGVSSGVATDGVISFHGVVGSLNIAF